MWVKGFKRVNMIVRGPFVSNAQPNHPEKCLPSIVVKHDKIFTRLYFMDLFLL